MVHHDISWYIMIYHGPSWIIMVHHGISWYIKLIYKQNVNKTQKINSMVTHGAKCSMASKKIVPRHCWTEMLFLGLLQAASSGRGHRCFSPWPSEQFLWEFSDFVCGFLTNLYVENPKKNLTVTRWIWRGMLKMFRKFVNYKCNVQWSSTVLRWKKCLWAGHGWTGKWREVHTISPTKWEVNWSELA